MIFDRHLLKILFAYELQRTNAMPFTWNGDFSRESVLILAQVSAFAIFKVLTKMLNKIKTTNKRRNKKNIVNIVNIVKQPCNKNNSFK